MRHNVALALQDLGRTLILVHASTVFFNSEVVDQKLDKIFELSEIDKTKSQELLEVSNIKEDLPYITDRINWLTDLQTRVGQARLWQRCCTTSCD